MQRWDDILAENSEFLAKRHRLQFTRTGSDLTLTVLKLTSSRSGVPAWFGKSNPAWKLGGTLCCWGDPASVVRCVPSTTRAGSE